MPFEPKPLTDDVSASAQILLEDIEAVHKAGFKSVIINRPDGEMPGQPNATDLEKTLKEQGIEAKYVPMSPGELTIDLIQMMATALEELPKPVVAFCASGTRSTILWCCANAKVLGVDTVLERAAAAGYNLEQFRPMFAQLSQ